MDETSKIGIAVALLAVSSALLLWSGFATSQTVILLAVAAVATTGLAAGSLLLGSTGSDGRMV